MSTQAVAQAWFIEAFAHHQAGRLAEAERLYRQTLEQEPRHADGLHLLGVIAHQVGRHDAAVAMIGQAIAINPWSAAFHANLGSALLGLGQLEDATLAVRKAVLLGPTLPEAYYTLGNLLRDSGRAERSKDCFRRALLLRPDYAEAHNNLAVILGNLTEDALAHFIKAVALRPNDADSYSNIGGALFEQGNLVKARRFLRIARLIRPDHLDAGNNLGRLSFSQGRLDEALACLKTVLSLKPDYPDSYNNLANALKDRGQLELAMSAYGRTFCLRNDKPEAHSNLLLCINYLTDQSAAAVLTAHRAWDDRHGRVERCGHSVKARSGRLRVGYVSPDFRRHSVASFLEPLLRHHDRSLVEIFCYAEVAQPDAVTQMLRDLSDHWRSTVGVSDADLAQRIKDDEIDILVDLAGHTAKNRLPVFARKPAPIQVTWLGYPNTTGLSAMDYRLVDQVTDPDGVADRWASEKLLRLPDGFLCYGPPPEAPLPAPLPMAEKGFVTFGSFNNPAKLSGAALDLWAALLQRVARSRLMLKGLPFADSGTRDLLLGELARRGVPAHRVSLLGQLAASADHLRLYGEIDIALDPFPYNGTTTTCEALWMGVPVVTLQGDRHAARVGASLLTRVGLTSLIANDPEAYLDIAAGLAADPSGLAELRAGLRTRMASSKLCDGPGFAKRVEAAYRAMSGSQS